MKQLHLVYLDGKLVGSQLAGYADRACALFAARRDVPYSTLSAAPAVASEQAQIAAAWDSFFKGEWKEC